MNNSEANWQKEDYKYDTCKTNSMKSLVTTAVFEYVKYLNPGRLIGRKELEDYIVRTIGVTEERQALYRVMHTLSLYSSFFTCRDGGIIYDQEEATFFKKVA